MSSRIKRILKETNAASKSDVFEFFDDTEGMFGEKNTYYIRFWVNEGAFAGQVHILEVRFTWGTNVVYKYPMKPLIIRFVTPMFHTNISPTGSICLDVLKESHWSPMYSIGTVYNSIIFLLEVPNHASPFNSTASIACRNNLPEVYREMTMDYYIKKMPTDAYKRAIPILQFDGFTTGMPQEALENRADYIRKLKITLGLGPDDNNNNNEPDLDLGPDDDNNNEPDPEEVSHEQNEGAVIVLQLRDVDPSMNEAASRNAIPTDDSSEE